MIASGTVWPAIALVALVTFACKGVGPLVIGARELPAPLVRVVALLGSALLAALVVTTTLAVGDRLQVGAKAVGLGVACLLLWRRAHIVVVVLTAAAVTATLRAAGLS